MINHELNQFMKEEDAREAFIEAVGRQYWYWCPQGCQATDNVFQNWLGGKQAWQYITPEGEATPSWNMQMARELALRVVNAQSTQDNAWTTGWAFGRPWDWANLEPDNAGWFKEYVKRSKRGDQEHEIYYASRIGERRFYILTGGQQNLWCNGSCLNVKQGMKLPPRALDYSGQLGWLREWISQHPEDLP